MTTRAAAATVPATSRSRGPRRRPGATSSIYLSGSQPFWDSTLSVRDGSCTGAQQACSDDACGGPASLQGRVTVTLAAGQSIVIIVDGASDFDGSYQLAITLQ